MPRPAFLLGFALIVSPVAVGLADDGPASGARADRPPRKVVVGTAIFRPDGSYPGLDEREKALVRLVDEMAWRATVAYPGRGLDLAVLPESALTSIQRTASERAVPLEGRVRETFGALARKHKTYLILPLDLAETGPGGTSYANAAVLFDREGAIAGIYRKAHPVALLGTDELEGGIRPGGEFPVFRCDFGVLGIQICWDMQFDDGWDALADKGAEVVAWPSASPSTALPASRAGRHRYYVVSSTWREDATVFEPTGLVAAQVEPPGRVLVHQIDLSYAVLGWSSPLRDGKALAEKFGGRAGYHYVPREDLGLFWSNDRTTTIGAMLRSLGLEGIDAQVERNRRLQAAARPQPAPGDADAQKPPARGAKRPRARELGVPFEGATGPLNAITDVRGVEVGHATLIAGEGKLVVGQGPVRTGVTAILPRGRAGAEPAFAGWFSLNGNGEMTGTTWVEESGYLEGPVMITNTHSVGLVRDALIAYRVRQGRDEPSGGWWSLPVVAETWDGYLNDINGFHVKERHAVQALEGAGPGPVPEGSVGGGTGMVCYEFKGGIGTSSRRVGGQTVGVLVQANHGLRGQLLVAGVPVGREVPEGAVRRKEAGSIIIVVATDAPLLPHQLKRLARRASMGLARTGSVSGNGSGDIFLAFSTAPAGSAKRGENARVEFLPNERMDPVFTATVQATEEAIVNALVAAETMTGVDGHRVVGLPHDRLREVLRKYNRLDADGGAGGK